MPTEPPLDNLLLDLAMTIDYPSDLTTVLFARSLIELGKHAPQSCRATLKQLFNDWTESFRRRYPNGENSQESSQEIDSMNTFGVGSRGNRICVLLPQRLQSGITRDEAIQLAAWLLALAQADANHTLVEVLAKISEI